MLQSPGFTQEGRGEGGQESDEGLTFRRLAFLSEEY